MCPPLSRPINVSVAPLSCLHYSNFSSVCFFSCSNGFRIRGTTSRLCTSNSVWTGQNDTRCEDIEPPTFSQPCQHDTIYNLDKCSNNITVNWTTPVATDNSGIVRVIGPSQGPPLTLFAGVYAFSYTAIDPTGNKRRCSFKIQVNKHECGQLTNPDNGFITSMTCSNMYGSVATFSCRSGYTMTGSTTRNCLLNRTWSGMNTQCIRVTCPALKPLRYGNIKPDDCIPGIPLVSGTFCLFKCNNGYKNVGPHEMTCTENGTWPADTSKISCQDYLPPRFLHCPSDVTDLTTDPGKKTATFNWSVPIPEDNSGNISSLTVEPKGVSPPFQFPLGITILKYTAKDLSNLESHCLFTIKVEDAEAPTPTFCPRNFDVTARERFTTVYFPKAIFEDNVGVTNVITDRLNGSSLSIGEHHVTYTAYDKAGNSATCTLNITVLSISCERPAQPKHGVLSCLTLTGGMYCTVHCHEGYIYPLPENELLICTHTGIWVTQHVPDCQAPELATVTFEGNLHYVTKKCEERKEAIRMEFIEKMKLNLMGQMHCVMFPSQCQLSNVVVTCKKKRKKRSLNGDERLDISFEMKLPFVKNSSSSVDKNNTVAEIKSSVMDSINQSVSKFEVDGQVITLDKSTPNTLKFVGLTCESGQVLKGSACVTCPPGYFHSVSSKSCLPCSVNQYQELEGQTSCKTCPPGTSGPDGQTASTSSKMCSKGPDKGPSVAIIVSIVVVLVVVIVLVVVAVRIYKIHQCKRTAGNSIIHGDRIVFGPKKSQEQPNEAFHMDISNPTYEGSYNDDHVYEEISDTDIHIYDKLDFKSPRRKREPIYENKGFEQGTTQA